MLLYRGIFTQRYFYAEIFLHGDAFTHGNAFTHIYFYTEMITADTDAARKSSASRCKTRISLQLLMIAFCAKGFCEGKQHVNFTGFFFQRSNRIYCKRIYRQNHPNAKERNFTAILTCFDDRNTEERRKITCSGVFEDRDAFRGKGLSHIATSPQFLRIAISRGLCFVGINPRCPAALREN